MPRERVRPKTARETGRNPAIYRLTAPAPDIIFTGSDVYNAYIPQVKHVHTTTESRSQSKSRSMDLDF